MARLQIHAVPNARTSAFAGHHGTSLKIKLAAPPEDGRANAELLRFLAESLDLPRSALSLQRGASSREKTVQCDGIDDATAVARLTARK